MRSPCRCVMACARYCVAVLLSLLQSSWFVSALSTAVYAAQLMMQSMLFWLTYVLIAFWFVMSSCSMSVK